MGMELKTGWQPHLCVSSRQSQAGRRICDSDSNDSVGSPLSNQGVPNAGKPEVLEVLRIHGGEFGHALLGEGEGDTPVVGTAGGKHFIPQARPEGVVKRTAIGRESEDLPAGMLAKGLADIRGSRNP